ncbi:hypothetical protein JY651_31335 [Pyxidicoccus parkwayensis]|uniref:Uncharacterized protein n=1 Tax=Pyxidicoccus parkwayensis TaxID=2813578 RepID=A0ABX7NQB1_9BACT|nr:hypothetical protein [Pyxidicoccus parkwaysis]QSQ19765.1 hypothetical protein JY651_31335 [Pyxidicoccus parkwaysis]
MTAGISPTVRRGSGTEVFAPKPTAGISTTVLRASPDEDSDAGPTTRAFAFATERCSSVGVSAPTAGSSTSVFERDTGGAGLIAPPTAGSSVSVLERDSAGDTSPPRPGTDQGTCGAGGGAVGNATAVLSRGTNSPVPASPSTSVSSR